MGQPHLRDTARGHGRREIRTLKILSVSTGSDFPTPRRCRSSAAGGDGRGAEPDALAEHDCVMLELVLVAIVLGEPAGEPWARLRALA
jgi:hypothetical protein